MRNVSSAALVVSLFNSFRGKDNEGMKCLKRKYKLKGILKITFGIYTCCKQIDFLK